MLHCKKINGLMQVEQYAYIHAWTCCYMYVCMLVYMRYEKFTQHINVCRVYECTQVVMFTKEIFYACKEEDEC